MPLNYYFRDISKHKILSKEEEKVVIERISKGDKKAINDLVLSNLRFVIKIAKKYQGYGMSLSELISEGNVGLMIAAEKFNTSNDVRFCTYAVWWIRQTITRALKEKSDIIRLPVYLKTRLIEILRKRRSYLAMGILDEHEIYDKIAIDLKMKSSDIELYISSYTKMVKSLDYKSNPLDPDDEDDDMYSFLLSSINVEASAIRNNIINQVRKIINIHLTEREKKIVMLRWGFYSDPLTLESIGKSLNLCRERIRQLESRSRRKIKKKIEKEDLICR